MIREAADVLIVRERLNDACPLFFWRVCLALILLAMSIGLVQVAGSATTLPLRGPDVHLNFLVVPPDLVRPSTLPPTSVTTSTSYNSNSLMSVFNLSTHTFQRTGFNAHLSTHYGCCCADCSEKTDQKKSAGRRGVAEMPHLWRKCHTSIHVAKMPHHDPRHLHHFTRPPRLYVSMILPETKSVNPTYDLR